MLQPGDDAEGADVHEGVGQDVVEQRGNALVADRPGAGVEGTGGLVGGEADQHVAGVGDRGVGQEALDVALGDGDHVAEGHRQEGEDGNEILPVVAQGAKALDQNPDRGGEGGRLRHDRHEGGHGGRGAVVGVRRPEVERDRRHLEAEADDQEEEAEEEGGIEELFAGNGGLEAVGDLVEVGRPGRAVDPGHAVGEDRGGEDAEEEVLQGAFDRGDAALGEGGEDVGGEGGELDADEDHHQIAGGGT